VADRETYSRAGTARALVLLAAGLAVGGAVLLCLLSLFLFAKLAPAFLALGAFALVSAIAAVLLTIRARSLRAIVGLGCGTLLAGVLIGLAVMLLLISRIAGNPA
jgi:hypothetical protein